MHLERSVLKIIRGEKKAPIASAALALLSSAYRAAIATRNFAYDREWISAVRLPAAVVSIGNIATGGTGKTPLVRLLASELQDRVKLAILTRGFRSQIEKLGESRLISSGNGPLCPPQECGDEPYLLAQKLKSPIWVGPDRVASGHLAIQQGAQCLLLDDGMQHRRLKRDFEIAVVDGLDPFSKGRFLPWGLLRDSPKRLRAADLIVFTHVKDLEHYAQLQKQMAPHLDALKTAAVQFEVVGGDKISARKVGVFCGIGNPERFLQTVRDLKCEIVDTLLLNDHEPVQDGRLKNFAMQCRDRGAEILLCTEKDYVKLGGAQHVMLEQCAVQIDKMQGAAERRAPEADDPAAGRRWRATQQIGYLHQQCSALQVKDHLLRPDLSLCLKAEPVEIDLRFVAGKEHWEDLISKILEIVK